MANAAGKVTNLFNEIKNILVINELYITPVYFFFSIFFLLHLENMLSNIVFMLSN